MFRPTSEVFLGPAARDFCLGRTLGTPVRLTDEQKTENKQFPGAPIFAVQTTAVQIRRGHGFNLMRALNT
jgi:hypothetical protein